MKKLYTYLILPVLVALCVSACSESAPAVPAIELQGGNELNIGAEGGSLNLRFQSTFPWTAASDESWCTLTTKSGEGGSISLPIEVKPNETFESRYANITLRSETVLCKVKVVQAAHGAVTLVVKHTAPKFNIPVFTGASIRGTVTWGDGAQEDYQKSLSHEYAEQKEYTTTISITGVETVELENISGIAEIDFTGF